MASRHRVENLSRPGYFMNLGAAIRAVDACSVKWVVEGESIRNLTYAEARDARNEQAKLREPLPYAEIHGLKFDPPASGVAATKLENSLLWAAHDFMRTASVA